jgi:P-type Ca2+ transporter type 2C
LDDLKKGTPFHLVGVDEALSIMGSGRNGLTPPEAETRLGEFGRNELVEGERKTILRMFIDQFNNIMIIVLMIAAAISAVLGEVTDMFIIMIVVILNAVLGVLQENKAEKALAALKSMSTPFVKVRRGGDVAVIKTELVVPGDVVILEAGDFVPADMRLIRIASLKIDEAPLTGESVPVEKSAETIDDSDMVIGDMINMAFSGSTVTYGRGEGVVVSTGMNTEVGKIATNISSTEASETPLQVKLHELTKFLTIAIFAVSVVIFIVGVVEGREVFEMMLTAVSLAVAAIPEGLPAVITIILALGVQKMAKRNAIVRKLSAVETLGSTQVICSDKTGTLTQNRMTVKEAFVGMRSVPLSEVSTSDPVSRLYLQSMVLCNDTKAGVGYDGEQKLVGDPTETALVSFASVSGIDKLKSEEELPRVEEIPFDSERKLMTTVHQRGDRYIVFTKGAPDVLISRCDSVISKDGAVELGEGSRQEIFEANSAMAHNALRVLAVAYKEIESVPESMESELVENGLIFLGLIGMIDPPRPEAKRAVEICAMSGIRAVMITGDHKDTATAIARELGMIKDEDEVITGAELSRISDSDFDNWVTRYSVYARVSPDHKVRIVDAWKRQGKIVAMTGDGVNDAPALKHSDIGIGMGITGTDVSKSVSNIVLADDNFATIVVAVEEGRKVYSNMRKTIQFLLSCNLGEVTTLFVATMLNWTILLPIHILWVNLVTDTFPALALGVDNPEKDIMKKKPRKAKDSFFSGGVGASIVYQGIAEGAIVLGAYYYSRAAYGLEVATTVSFATLSLVQLVHTLNVRSVRGSVLSAGIMNNRYLIMAVLFSAALQIGVISIPFLNTIFKVVPLSLAQWGVVGIASLSIIPVVEVGKAFMRIAYRGREEE